MREMPGCEIIEQNIQVKHVHMLMVIPPKYAMSDAVGEIKQYTASKIRKKFTWLDRVYWKESVVWSPVYFVSTVGLDEKEITKYVKWQGQQDSGQAKLDM
jgi:putative transposase